MAGHSLGEYTALAAAGAFSLADAARLLKTRGQAMQAAVPVGVGAMSALLGAEIAMAEEAAREAVDAAEPDENLSVCVVANDNAPGQVVISGTAAAVARAGEIAKAKGAKRAMPLAVSAPFHCPLMKPAADKMAEALAEVTIRPPAVPVVANVTAAEVSEPETDPPPAGRAGDGPGALARKRARLPRARRRHDSRIRRRQGADRHGQAHRQGTASR